MRRASRTTRLLCRSVLAPVLTVVMLGSGAFAAGNEGSPKPECSATGIAWTKDPVFLAAEHPSDSGRALGPVACQVATAIDLMAGDASLRLTLGRLYRERVGGVRLPVELVDIARVGPQGPRSVGRVLLSEDPIDREMRFEPQVRVIDGGILIRLAPRHPWLFRLDDGGIQAVSASGWRDVAEATMPEASRGGALLSVDLQRMEGRIAVHTAGVDPTAARLPSAYDGRRMAVANLVWRSGALVADVVTTLPQQPGDEPALDRFHDMDETIRAGLRGLPEGTEPCSLGAWSNDTDPKGLNVRAAPGPGARVLGIVPPPRKLPKEHEAFPGPAKAEFRIIGHREGWFLIESITAPGAAYDAPYPRHLPQPYKGRGWVNGRLIGAALANGGLPEGRLYNAPHADAASRLVVDANGSRLGVDTAIRRIHACSGWWGLVETNEGQRGWWRALCSNQVTNCS